MPRLDALRLAAALATLAAFVWGLWLTSGTRFDPGDVGVLAVAAAGVVIGAAQAAQVPHCRQGRTAHLAGSAVALSIAAACGLSLRIRTDDELAVLAAAVVLIHITFWVWTVERGDLRGPAFRLSGLVLRFVGIALVAFSQGWSGWRSTDASAILLAALIPALTIVVASEVWTTQVATLATSVAVLLALTSAVSDYPWLVAAAGAVMLFAVATTGPGIDEPVSSSTRDVAIALFGTGAAFILGIFSLDDPIRSFAFASSVVLAAAALQGGRLLLAERDQRLAELARINARVEELARLDYLTGLPNRAALEARILEEVERSVRYRQPMSVCFIDIDHFKQINDQLGHATGDRLLQQIAAVVRSTIRTPDFVARYGGEEFVVIAPGTWTADAVMLGERIQRAIAGQVEHVLGRPVTVSIGIAGVPEHGTEAAAVLELADEALYGAKSGGRNRVEISGGGRDLPPS